MTDQYDDDAADDLDDEDVWDEEDDFAGDPVDAEDFEPGEGDVLHDGFVRGAQDMVIDIPAMMVLPGPIPEQLDRAMLTSPDADADEVMNATLYGNDAANFDAVADLDIDANDGRMRVEVNGEPRELQSIALDERPADQLESGKREFLLRLVDTKQDTWLMRIETPANRAVEVSTPLAAIAKHHNMVSTKPSLWAQNQADTADFMAVDPQTVAAVVIAPNPEDKGWAMVVEHDAEAGHAYSFNTAGQAIDAMRETLDTLNRSVAQLQISYVDPDTNKLAKRTLSDTDLRNHPDALDLPVAEEFFITALVGNEPKLPNVVGGVVLEKDWLAYRRGGAEVTTNGAARVTEALLYPAGRSNPHSFDVSAAAPAAEPAETPKPAGR